MENLDKIIASNITKLRKEKKLTQMELAEKINFSDKSVSKWENAESIPSVDVLLSIAKFFNITLNDLIAENLNIEKTTIEKKAKYSRLVITSLAILTVWLVATMVFVFGQIFWKSFLWISFVYAIPVSCIVAIVFNSIWGKWKYLFYILTVFNWTLSTSLYLQFLNFNIYPVFFISVVLQLGIFLWASIFVKNNAKTRAKMVKKLNNKRKK